MSVLNETLQAIQHREVSCPVCMSFSSCKDIDEKYADTLKENGGDYRKVRQENGTRLSSPIRRCVRTIFKEHAQEFKGKEILEIGCGPLSPFSRDFVLKNQIRYTGIEPERLMIYGLPYSSSQSKIFSYLNAAIKRINYPIFHFLNLREKFKQGPRLYYLRKYFPVPELPSESFDVIYASSSIEHWHENLAGSSSDEKWNGSTECFEEGVQRYQKDIQECYRLLRKNGNLVIDCPIHVHGNGIFYHGEIDMIFRIFESVPWKSLRYEYWRRDYSGLLPYMLEERKKNWVEKWGRHVSNIWILNVVASK